MLQGIKKICLITNYNLYESKRHFSAKLAESLERKGVRTLLIDVEENAIDVVMARKIQDFQPDLTCSFNSLEPLYEDQFLWDLLRIPHLSLLVDPAFYSLNLINSPYSILSCVDREDVRSIQAEGFRNVFFLPHGVEKELFDSEAEEKEYEAVFIGTCYDYESLEEVWKTDLSPQYQQILQDAVDCFESSPEKNLDQALREAWSASKVPPNSEYVLELYHYLDSYTRGKDRVNLIKSLKDVQIHIFGTLSQETPGSKKGWKEYFKGTKNVHVHSPVNYQQSFEILRKSKICLNSMPFFKDGTHERIFNGYACHCFPVTTDNKYIREQFTDRNDICLYFKGLGDEQNGFLHSLIYDDALRRHHIEKARRIVRFQHTWDNRADELLLALPPILQRINKMTNPGLL